MNPSHGTNPTACTSADTTVSKEARIYRDHPTAVTAWILIVVITTFTLMAAFCYSWFGRNTNFTDPPLSILAMLSGIFGSWLSVMIKLADTKHTTRFTREHSDSSKANFWSGFKAFHFISLPGLIGAFLGLVMALLFASKLVQGSLFPAMRCAQDAACTSFSEMTRNYTVQDPENLAKLIFWCFMAGFAERFVLNILDGYSEPRGERGGGAAQ